MNTGISILIRTYNSAGTLPAVLARLAVQPGDEIIVVDSGSGDATLAIAQKNSARILVAEPPFNYSKSLNLGFAAAKNPWVLVISSHCVPSSETLVETFRVAAGKLPEAVNVAYGECSLIERHDIPEPPTGLLADKNSDAHQHRKIYGGNGLALYRRAAWQAQPFDETLPTGKIWTGFCAPWLAAESPLACRRPGLCIATRAACGICSAKAGRKRAWPAS